MDENPLDIQKVSLREEFPVPEPLSPPEPPYVTGGPAFPSYPTDDHKHGISILDYFAAHIMAGLCMRPELKIDDLKSYGPQDAYWIAALMVDVRGKLPIEPTPAPPGEELPEEEEISGADAVRRDLEARLGRKVRTIEL